jgi:hypothetical protein
MDAASKRNHVIYIIRLFQLNIGGVLFTYEEFAFYKVKRPALDAHSREMKISTRGGTRSAREPAMGKLFVLNKTPYYL